jgi:hypothetical protein
MTATGNRDVTVRARPFGPDGCGPVTANGNRDKKEIRSMSGPVSERVPDITVTVEADGRSGAELDQQPFL